MANIVSTYKSRWTMQFNVTKPPLSEGFDDRFRDQGFDVKVVNKSKFVVVHGSRSNKEPNKGNIIKKGSNEAATFCFKK